MTTQRSAPQPQPLPNHRCPLCGGPNGCAAAAAGSFEVECWCRRVEIDPAALARIAPEWRGRSCICAACAAAGGRSPVSPAAAGRCP